MDLKKLTTEELPNWSIPYFKDWKRWVVKLNDFFYNINDSITIDNLVKYFTSNNLAVVRKKWNKINIEVDTEQLDKKIKLTFKNWTLFLGDQNVDLKPFIKENVWLKIGDWNDETEVQNQWKLTIEAGKGIKVDLDKSLKKFTITQEKFDLNGEFAILIQPYMENIYKAVERTMGMIPTVDMIDRIVKNILSTNK